MESSVFLPKSQILEIWGDFACFSRPELKVERFSYPVITPSAARGIFDAIYSKPHEFIWRITKIEVLSMPQYIALRRNEVKNKALVSEINSWIKGNSEPVPLLADATQDILSGVDTKGRTQRQTMALKDVHYRIHALIYPWPEFKSRIKGLEEQFRRRASKGKCFYQPYLGCREFPAYFELLEPKQPLAAPMNIDINIGWMLYDVFNLSSQGDAYSTPSVSIFNANVKNGVLLVPEYESKEVLKDA
ncbi:MAG: type I-C CRISPR-associated protein Cas5c [Synergistaceae bacterium]|nr:type I-C CRISPR-associated protein Cas5c [Synergistaceae bacterium]